MNVYCTSIYPAMYFDNDDPRYEAHMSCLSFIRTLKAEYLSRVRYLAGLPLGRGYRDNAFTIFSCWMAQLLREISIPVVLVPVPSSSLHVGIPEEQNQTTSYLMCQAAAEKLGRAVVFDVLRFVTPHDPAHRGGNPLARDPAWLLRNLVLLRALRVWGRLVLVDDVLTTGSHLRACRDLLRREAPWLGEPIGVCAGRTVHAYVDVPFYDPEVTVL